MPDVRVIIPSFRRAKLITAHRLLETFEICIPESDYPSYLEAGFQRHQLVCHPDTVLGLARKRNWIFDNLQGKDAILSLDDDIAAFIKCFTGVGETGAIKDPAEVHAIVDNTAQISADLGAYYFGFDNSGDSRTYNGLKPFVLTGFINGWSIGFLPGHGIRCDERLVAKAEFDIALRNAHKHRICCRNTMYSFVARNTFHNMGGLAVYRNSHTEDADMAILAKTWGHHIRLRSTAIYGKVTTSKTDGYTKPEVVLPYS